MVYQRSASRAPSDRRTEYAMADDVRAEARRIQDLTLDNTAGKWRYKAVAVKLRSRADKL